jgi:hypothetical protein
MDETIMTQLTLFSIAMSYLWLLVVIALTTTIVLRRRRLLRLEVEYARQNPPMPFIPYTRATETQEAAAVAPSESREPTRRLRHINPSDQVMIDIHPDTEQLVAVKNSVQNNLQKLYAHLNRSSN